MMMKNFILGALLLCWYPSFAWGSGAGLPIEHEELELLSTQRVRLISVTRSHYGDIESTQTTANDHLSEVSKTKWIVVTSDSQRKGRGYWGREWVSPEGNLFATFCVPFDPKIMPRISLLPAVVGLSICDTLEALGVDKKQIGLRWINNVLVEGQKIAGSIVDIKGNIMKIGIGINVDLSDDVVNGIDQAATSLRHLLGETPERDAVLDILTQNLVPKLREFMNGSYDPWIPYKNKLLYLEEEVEIYDGEKRTEGLFRSINKDGGLILDIAGEMKEFSTGEISPEPKAIIHS